MKKLLLALLFVLSISFLTGCNEVKFDESKGELVVGLECNYAPFNWLETKPTETNYPVANVEGGYADGYDVQMAKLIADELGYTLVLKRIVWDGLIEGLKAGSIDLIIAGMSPTEERKLSINFSEAYYETTHVILTKADSKFANAKTFADLAGAKAVGQKGTTYDDLAGQVVTKSGSGLHQPPLASVPEIINSIKSGVSDLTVLEKPVAEGLVEKDSELKYFQLNEKFDLDESDTIVSIGLRKSDDQLLEKVNAALAKISKETRDQLMSNAIKNQPTEE